MPVANIVDHRSNNKVLVVNIVAEPSFHDNKCPGATQFENDGSDKFYYKDFKKQTIAQTIIELAGYDFPITLYLYDVGIRL